MLAVSAKRGAGIDRPFPTAVKRLGKYLTLTLTQPDMNFRSADAGSRKVEAEPQVDFFFFFSAVWGSYFLAASGRKYQTE